MPENVKICLEIPRTKAIALYMKLEMEWERNHPFISTVLDKNTGIALLIALIEAGVPH